MNNLNSSQPISGPLDFNNIYRDFELRETLEKTKTPHSNELTQSTKSEEQINIEQIDNMIRTLPYMNDNIRANIKLGIEIYKKLNNIDRNYIHEIINEKSKNSK
jgi:hypothetical protein